MKSMHPIADAARRVEHELGRILHPHSPFRVGVLLVSYTAPDGDTHISYGSGMQAADLDCAYDLVQMVQALRSVADNLEAQIKGRAPIEFRATDPKEPLS